MKRLIVVDVSNFIFRAFFAIRPLTSPEGVPVNAVYGVLSMFLKLLSQYRPTHVLMARDTAGGSFRNEMYDAYKANRSEPPEDLIPQFALIKELIQKMEMPFAEDQNFEADDIIGSAVTQYKDHFDEILIASGDKDLMQFVGDNIKMLDTMKDKIYDADGVFEKMGVRPDQIVDYLSMVGDTSDNIPGMRGIGAKGAAKLLAQYETLDECIAHKDEMKGKKLTTAFGEHLEEGLLSRKLIKIVTDVELGLKAEELSIKFYPTEELIEFLRGLGFDSTIKKLEDLKKAEYDAENNGAGGELSSLGPKTFTNEFVKTDAQFKSLLKEISGAETFSFYTEYDSGDVLERKLSSISISLDGEKGFVCDELSTQQAKELLELVWSDDKKEVISDHWKRDFFYALENGFEIKCKTFDTTQVHYILNPGARHDIISTAKEYMDYTILKRDKKDPFLNEVEAEEKVKFLGDRACCLFVLHSMFSREMGGKDLNSVYYEIDNPLIPTLAKMERVGVSLDEKTFKDLEVDLERMIKEIEEEVAKYSDGETINLNSPKQVSEFLFEKLELPVVKKTKTGYSTDSEVLETLDGKDLSPVPGLILKYREYGKLLSTYVKTLPELRHKRDGRVHTHFNQDVAATGRLSSNNPNLQNIPIRTELGRSIRKGFIAAAGYKLIGADYSQVELRLLAHFSEDPTMLKAFQNGEDIHRQTAAEIMGLPLSEVSSEERSRAKAVNFGLMYGQSSFGLASQLKISRKEAKDYITNYFERFSRVKNYLDTLKEKAEKDGFAITLMGRKRYLPDIHSKNRTIKSMAERVAINSPIQGTAADIIKMAMINIQNTIEERGLKSQMILQVHDELIFEVPDNEVDTMKELIREKMENVVQLKVPLTVDVGEGQNWYQLK